MERDKKNTDNSAMNSLEETGNPPEVPGVKPDASDDSTDAPREVNGPKGPEPTRYGDWEQKGRCSDF